MKTNRAAISYKTAVADIQVAFFPDGCSDKFLSSEPPNLIRITLIVYIDEINEGTPLHNSQK